MFDSKLTLKGRVPITPGPEKPMPPPKPPEASSEKFWLVWCTTGLAPRRRHATLESATIEAERLGRREPEKTFLVYEARLVVEDESEKETT
jgi:hypothetical protein